MTRHSYRDSALSRRSATGRLWMAGLAALLMLLPAAAWAQSDYGSGYDDDYGDEPAGYDTGYSFLRTLDGSATLIQGADHDESGERTVAEINQPVFTGDRLWVSPGSRAEVVLSDGNLLRIDGDSEVLFERLAFSPETDDEVTTLRLLRGNVLLVVVSDSLGEQLPRLDTSNATIYPQDFGTYRLTSDGTGWTELVVRRGRAEVVSDGGSEQVAADRRALVEGTRQAWTELQAAGAFDSLERWAADLDRGVEEVPYVDQELRYAAAPLERHGTWVTVEGSRAWQPRVEVGWRPYYHGRWSYSPAGLIWISSEPWGWVPYHYGTWDYSPVYGWVWLPGRRFSPGWVYWHWGSAHVAWVPVGYYARHWGPRFGFGVRFGVYGWAGGSWDYYDRWNFCPRGYFGTRYQGRHVLDGRGYGRRYGGRDVPRGILTTDTRRLGRRDWRDGEGSLKALRTRPGRDGRIATAELPDVTPFVRRGGDLPADVRRRVAVDRTGGTRVAGTPLAPGSKDPGRRAALPRATVGTRSGGSDRTEVVRRGEVGRPGGADRADLGKPTVPRGADSRGPANRSAVIRSDRRAPAPSAGKPTAVQPRASGPTDRGATGRGTAERGANDRPTGNRGVVIRRPAERKPAADERPAPERATTDRAAEPRRVGTRAPKPDRGQPAASSPRSDSSAGARPRVERSAPVDRGAGSGVRSRSEVYRAPAPRSGPKTAPRSSAPRSSAPRAPAPRSSAPASRGSSPAPAPSVRRSPDTGRRTTSPSRPTVRRSPTVQRTPAVKRGPTSRSAPSRSPAPVRRSAPRASAPRASAPRSSAPRSSAPRASAPRASAPRFSAPRARSAPRSSGKRPAASSSSGSSSRGGSKRSTARRAKPRPRND